MKSALRIVSLAAVLAASALAAAASAQTAASTGSQPSQWRTVAPENLLVIDTNKGRILVELDPRVAPNHVARVRELADRGFYDGLKWHRVIANFMAQTGDPLGTGAGGSELPDLKAEFTFRRTPGPDFTPVMVGERGQTGLFGSLPAVTQPDAQALVTADMKVQAGALFCPGVAGAARTGSPDTANSQFFLMTGANANLNGVYTVFGRVLQGLEVVMALKTGSDAADGAVTDNPDIMTHVRTADGLPEGQRPTARVADPRDPAVMATIDALKASRGTAFSVCDIQPTVQVTGG